MNKYKEALNRMEESYYNLDNSMSAMKRFNEDIHLLKKLVNQAELFEWIPFTFDDEGVLNCELPDVGEEILVSDGDSVWRDTWCKAYKKYEFIKDSAWMPLPIPKPYKEKENER